MKIIKLFLIAVFISAAFAVNAQSSRLNGQEFTIVMIDEQNDGDEIFDVFSFNNNELTTQNSSKDGYGSAQISESGNTFEALLSKPSGETININGTTEGLTIFGNIVSTNNGQVVNFVFRGMTTEEWNRIRQLKDEAAGQ